MSMTNAQKCPTVNVYESLKYAFNTNTLSCLEYHWCYDNHCGTYTLTSSHLKLLT